MRKTIAELLRQAREEDWSRFDLAAECWAVLKDVISSEASFLARYCLEGPGHHNPNLQDLVFLERRLCVDLAGPDGGYVDRTSAYFCIEKDLESFSPVSFGDPSYNDATLLWALIRAIDQSCTEDRRLVLKSMACPLNDVGRDKIGIYTSACQGFILEHFAKSRIERIPELSFNDQLQNLMFYSNQGGAEYPRLVVASRSGFDFGTDSIVDASVEELEIVKNCVDVPDGSSRHCRELRIGMELFCGAAICGWRDDSPVRFAYAHGSSFTVSYSREHASLFDALVRESIDHAVEQRCDILIFPEIVMSSELVDTVCDSLKDPSRRGRLGLVVAGSGWYESPDGTEGNNVCVLIDGYGRIIGRTFKREPYVEKRSDGGTYDLVEALADPGKEITLVDLPGVGRIVSAICKDLAADSRFPIDLARDVNGDVICVPALSGSLDRGFGIQLSTLSERQLAVSCVCNLCSVRSSHGDDASSVAVGLVGYPAAGEGNPRQARPDVLEVKRGPRCQPGCIDRYESGAPRSCLRVIRIVSDDEGVGLTASTEWIACKT